MPTHPLAQYLADCRARRGTGATTPETSLYSPLETLLTTVGQKLKPRVRCFMNLRDQGAGLPDGGLFTPDQIARGVNEPPAGQSPSRGVIECKPPRRDVLAITETQQVTDYWNRYNQVLVTNYREFALIGRDDRNRPVRHEYHRLAANEREFWTRPIADIEKEHGERLLDFLRRCLLRPAPLTDPKDVAWFLASYARDARGRVEHSEAHETVAVIRQALEEALGLRVTDEKGEHFFQSTLVQTLFYGAFSAWVLWHRSGPAAGERFDWERAPHYLHVPILRKLFRDLTDPANLDEWDNLAEVMGWAADTLNRVDRGAFFEKFNDAEAVQYFYEPFLEAFDPELRKQLGVWYTPPEIVKYMVARVDQVLKSDFGRPDGLADPGVYVLDPCCGTGAYLVEVLNTIAATLRERGEDALLGGLLKQAAMDRVFGFEILPAPFVVAHLQLGLFLQQHGASLDERHHERPAVYLTNALTGWSPPTEPQRRLFPEMEEERDKADRIKQEIPILVVLGNPPYNGFAGLPVEEEAGLVEPYRTTRNAPRPQGQGLNDLYVRFFRIAERCITERHARHGIVCYISNYSWLDGLSHTGMRERFLDESDQIWIDCLNGDKYKTGKLTPEGDPDPSVFSTGHNREGIQVGTAVALLARTPQHEAPAELLFRDFWGVTKREELQASGQKFTPRQYTEVEPEVPLGLAFRPIQTAASYTIWPLLTELFPVYFTGVKTSRDDAVVDIDARELSRRMQEYHSQELSDNEIAAKYPELMQSTNDFDAVACRRALIARGFKPELLVPFAYRPFDNRWVYWESTELLNRPRPEYFPHVSASNLWLAASQQNRKDYDPPIAETRLACIHVIERSANVFPLLLRELDGARGLFASESAESRRLGDNLANVSEGILAYLASLRGICDAPQLFHQAIAIMHAPEYASENGAALRQDWPRIPLPVPVR